MASWKFMMYLGSHGSAYVIEKVDKSFSTVRDKTWKDIWGLNLNYFDMTLTPEKWLRKLQYFFLGIYVGVCVWQAHF